MLFVIRAEDRPNSLDLRLASRAAHLEWLSSLGEIVQAAGPFLDREGKPCGSLLIFEAETEMQVFELLKNDPYAQVGLFAEVEIRPWLWAVKKR